MWLCMNVCMSRVQIQTHGAVSPSFTGTNTVRVRHPYHPLGLGWKKVTFNSGYNLSYK